MDRLMYSLATAMSNRGGQITIASQTDLGGCFATRFCEIGICSHIELSN